MNFPHLLKPAALALLAGGAFGVISRFVPDSVSRPAQTAEAGAPAAAEAYPDLQPDEKLTVDIFNEVAASVVYISNLAAVRRGFSTYVEEIPVGTGSGFIWDTEGHVVTNYHVVRNATSIAVTLADQSVHRADLVGVFQDKEIAVLKIAAPAEKLKPIRVGTSKNLKVGMTALAIGNPFGLDHTLTRGIISALDREIQALTGRKIADCIQTDAAINPGNSGGPLLNSKGELIGINTAIFSPSGVNTGIGFAVPVDVVRRYVHQIIRDGRITAAGLGVGLLKDSVARSWGIRGVILYYVPAGGAAAKGGLRGTAVDDYGTVVQLGDVITKIESTEVTDVDGLRDALEKHAIGDEVEVFFLRDKKERKATVKLQSIELP